MMNKATIESVEWHKDQLFKLLEDDDDLIKIEGNIHSVKMELNEIIEKAKKRVWVKPTATKKGHYREQEVGRGEPSGVTGARKGKMKDLQKEMDEVRRDISAAMSDKGVGLREIQSLKDRFMDLQEDRKKMMTSDEKKKYRSIKSSEL